MREIKTDLKEFIVFITSGKSTRFDRNKISMNQMLDTNQEHDDSFLNEYAIKTCSCLKFDFLTGGYFVCNINCLSSILLSSVVRSQF